MAPSAEIYVSGGGIFGVGFLCVGPICAVVSLLLFTLQTVCILNYVSHVLRKACLIGIAALFPAISLASSTALLAPRTVYLAKFLIMMSVSVSFVSLCVLFRLCFADRHSMVKLLSERRLRLDLPPVCCLLPCLPRPCVSAKALTLLEITILQTVVCRLTLYLITWTIQLNYGDDPLPVPVDYVFVVFTVVMVPSTMFAMWALMVTGHLVSEPLNHLRFSTLIRLLQIVLLLTSFQGNVLKVLARCNVIQSRGMLSAHETAIQLHLLLLVVEMLFLSVVASLLLTPGRSKLFDVYRRPNHVVTTSSKSATQSQSRPNSTHTNESAIDHQNYGAA